MEEREHANRVSLKVRGNGFRHLAQEGRVARLKATLEERDALVATDPEAYGDSYVAGRFGWIEVRPAAAPVDEPSELISEAWRLSAPRRPVGESLGDF
ncbi:MmcQ/YjbR family DNA-binding protein [Thermomonospora umbrina]|uniref:YjbR protein n=1 Tax=Thermomonospora umbrina TaxID=111806 RepID=A0A3D9SJX7_9ACTN|nr:MmcQ/YjbR family DNA-binding protein [Thermomonospora umbrina]REE96007.1 YjbR protein [Thermomonospora umbrina]